MPNKSSDLFQLESNSFQLNRWSLDQLSSLRWLLNTLLNRWELWSQWPTLLLQEEVWDQRWRPCLNNSTNHLNMLWRQPQATLHSPNSTSTQPQAIVPPSCQTTEKLLAPLLQAPRDSDSLQWVLSQLVVEATCHRPEFLATSTSRLIESFLVNCSLDKK